MLFTPGQKNKKNLLPIFAGLLAIGLGVWVTVYPAGPTTQEIAIKKEIIKANYCSAQSDCQVVTAKCPFDCYAPVNKKEAGRIETLINNYESKCAYSCMAMQGVECVENKCDIQITSTTPNSQPERTTLTGEYTCLLHKDTTGPETDECAISIKTNDGKYYAFNTNLLSSTPPTLANGDQIMANGIITPIEMLSTDHWRKYNVQGIFSVTDSLKKLK